MDNSEEGQGKPCIDLHHGLPHHKPPNHTTLRLTHTHTHTTPIFASLFCTLSSPCLSTTSIHCLPKISITLHPHLPPLAVGDYLLAIANTTTPSHTFASHPRIPFRRTITFYRPQYSTVQDSDHHLSTMNASQLICEGSSRRRKSVQHSRW